VSFHGLSIRVSLSGFDAAIHSTELKAALRVPTKLSFLAQARHGASGAHRIFRSEGCLQAGAPNALTEREGQDAIGATAFTGEAMRFLMLAEWTGVAETELFARTYKS